MDHNQVLEKSQSLIDNYSFAYNLHYLGLQNENLYLVQDINTGKVRCGVANQLLNVCKSAIWKTEYLQVQLIEQVFARKGENIDKILCEREKYWQAQLFTLTHGLNSINEWYAINRREYRK